MREYKSSYYLIKRIKTQKNMTKTTSRQRQSRPKKSTKLKNTNRKTLIIPHQPGPKLTLVRHLTLILLLLLAGLGVFFLYDTLNAVRIGRNKRNVVDETPITTETPIDTLAPTLPPTSAPIVEEDYDESYYWMAGLVALLSVGSLTYMLYLYIMARRAKVVSNASDKTNPSREKELGFRAKMQWMGSTIWFYSPAIVCAFLGALFDYFELPTLADWALWVATVYFLGASAFWYLSGFFPETKTIVDSVFYPYTKTKELADGLFVEGQKIWEQGFEAADPEGKIRMIMDTTGGTTILRLYNEPADLIKEYTDWYNDGEREPTFAERVYNSIPGYEDIIGKQDDEISESGDSSTSNERRWWWQEYWDPKTTEESEEKVDEFEESVRVSREINTTDENPGMWASVYEHMWPKPVDKDKDKDSNDTNENEEGA